MLHGGETWAPNVTWDQGQWQHPKYQNWMIK